MIPLPLPNTRAHPYRGLSVQDVTFPLTPATVEAHLRGREVYRRTEYLLLRNGTEAALAAVRKRSVEPLFSPVTDARWLAGPDQITQVRHPDLDVGNATALAGVADPEKVVTVVEGRHEHVNFIWEPAPVSVAVTEVAPPDPPKLLDQARRVVAYDEDLPPIELVPDVVDLSDLARSNPASHYLLPCRGSGAELPGEVAFLDTRPAHRHPWLMIGCERSAQMHEHFYGDRPPQVDLCPRVRISDTGSDGGADTDVRVLTKCCLHERGVEVTGMVATVPWGATLDEVRTALRRLVGVDQQSTVSSGAPVAGDRSGQAGGT